jgi:flagellar hook-associated protein 3 FlgL
MAHVDGGLYLAHESPGAGAITVTETLAGASEDTDTLTGLFGSTLTGLSRPQADVVFGPEADHYIVLDSGGDVEAAGGYGDGAEIGFAGITTAVSGAPATGDRFRIAPSQRQDVFTTVANLVGALETGIAGATDRARLQNALNGALTDLDGALGRIDGVRSVVGTRLTAVARQQAVNSGLELSLRETLSGIEDLDLTTAAARLSRQLTALEAAQRTLVRVQGLSLFNFLP